MRLLNTRTLQVEEFSSDIPKYAILSHTWEKEEVTFQDMMNGKAEAKAGYSKIQRSSIQAITDGWGYIWIDTCCIDKRSSAELSEAINSMYRWYENSEVCYAYLADVSVVDRKAGESESPEQLRKSRWFTRGWTLQELIAPTTMVFFSQDWEIVGTKESLELFLEAMTEIEVSVLQRTRRLNDVPAARRMSWAAKRQTTRVEDTAYCLMGIFDVNMPLLYGEGKKAFTRLQEEILKTLDDHSLFAWTSDTHNGIGTPYIGNLLAESPANYAGSRDIIPFRNWGESTPYSMTNMGLSIKVDVDRVIKIAISRIMLNSNHISSVVVAVLNCWVSDNSSERVGIYLGCIEGDQHVRIEADQLASVSPYGYSRRAIFIRNVGTAIRPHDNVRGGMAFQIGPEIFGLGYRLTQVYPKEKWLNETFYPRTNGKSASAGIFCFENGAGDSFRAMIGSRPLPFGVNSFCWFQPGGVRLDAEMDLRAFQKSEIIPVQNGYRETFMSFHGTMSASMEELASKGAMMITVNFKLERTLTDVIRGLALRSK